MHATVSLEDVASQTYPEVIVKKEPQERIVSARASCIAANSGNGGAQSTPNATLSQHGHVAVILHNEGEGDALRL